MSVNKKNGFTQKRTSALFHPSLSSSRWSYWYLQIIDPNHWFFRCANSHRPRSSAFSFACHETGSLAIVLSPCISECS